MWLLLLLPNCSNPLSVMDAAVDHQITTVMFGNFFYFWSFISFFFSVNQTRKNDTLNQILRDLFNLLLRSSSSSSFILFFNSWLHMLLADVLNFFESWNKKSNLLEALFFEVTKNSFFQKYKTIVWYKDENKRCFLEFFSFFDKTKLLPPSFIFFIGWQPIFINYFWGNLCQTFSAVQR